MVMLQTRAVAIINYETSRNGLAKPEWSVILGFALTKVMEGDNVNVTPGQSGLCVRGSVAGTAGRMEFVSWTDWKQIATVTIIILVQIAVNWNRKVSILYNFIIIIIIL